MRWYDYIAFAAIFSQGLFLFFTFCNYRYALGKYKKKRAWYRPKAILIVPCKGIDSDFQKNIASFFNQNYENYSLWFVVAEESDPAYTELLRLKAELAKNSKASDVQVFVAEQGRACSQKIHNLLYCCKKIGADIEVLAFADSDICIHDNWLSHLVYPLRQTQNGAATGYRWYVPERNNLATLALSALNAKVAQLFGKAFFNQMWGGSMAVTTEVFRKLNIEKIWENALSDDLSLSIAVKKVGLKVAFVPACFVATYESTTWPKLFEFTRRQFLITRVNAPLIWWFGLFSGFYSVLGLWGSAAAAIYAANIGAADFHLWAAVSVVFFAGQLIRAVLRQRMISKLLREDLQRMKSAMIADILGFWLWSLLLLFFIVSSAFGRTIQWRGIKYKLLGPDKIIVLDER